MEYPRKPPHQIADKIPHYVYDVQITTRLDLGKNQL
jgi:hypothetical protein